MPQLSYIVSGPDGKPTVQKANAFCELLNSMLPNDSQSLSGLLEGFDAIIRWAEPNIEAGALNNSHGDWYEWLLAITAWNLFVDSIEWTNGDVVARKHIALLLPNVRQFDISHLYTNKLSQYILDLKQKVSSSSDVELITSNPDFVVFNGQRFAEEARSEGLILSRIDILNRENLTMIEEAFRLMIAKCSFYDIIGYISVKTSLRPDRRLQIPHEGSLMKAMYVHLQTRDWILNPPGLRYYAMSTNVKDADRKALKTVATHSITSVSTLPIPAVDEVFKVDTLLEAKTAFEQILS